MDITILYRIRDWGKHFENNRTRELRRMEFVLLPNRMDGDGYTELLDHEDGASHFGAWCALVQVASKCEPRGQLIRSNGKPHTPESLERLTRIPAQVFAAVLPRLVEIGWIEAAEIPQDNGTIPQDGAGKCDAYAGAHAIERNGMERNGTEHIAAGAATDAADSPSFEPEVLPQQAGNWEHFQEAIDRAGMRYSMPDLRAMQKRWANLSLQEQLAAVHHVHESVNVGAFAEPQYVPAARNYLFEKRWERGIRQRDGPRTDQRNIRALQLLVAQREAG